MGMGHCKWQERLAETVMVGQGVRKVQGQYKMLVVRWECLVGVPHQHSDCWKLCLLWDHSENSSDQYVRNTKEGERCSPAPWSTLYVQEQQRDPSSTDLVYQSQPKAE